MSPRTIHLFIATLTFFAVLIIGFTFFLERATFSSYGQTTYASVVEDSDILELPNVEDITTFGPKPALSMPSYFTETKEKFINDGIDFIEADLSEMRARVWKGGVAVLDVAIQTKGRPGSWWQTPAGVYKVDTKKEKHFSSFGHVYTNWNLPFQGNFFIHGWPYKEDGTPLPRGYSGGCIRLNDEDAEALFILAEVNMPVIVHEKGFEPDNFTYTPKQPTVVASAYLIVDIQNGRTLAEENATTSVPIASVVKFMTALIATEYINLDKDIVVSQTAIVPTSKPRLNAYESVLGFHLLYPLLIESSNEAAMAIAEHVGTERFVSLMNNKAKALGMHDTIFVDPSGVQAGNVSTAYDLALLAQYLYNNRPFLLALSSGEFSSGAYAKAPWADLVNYNLFGADAEFVGGKVGKSESAGETMLSIFRTPIYGTPRAIAYIVLGAQDVATQVQTLRDTVSQSYK